MRPRSWYDSLRLLCYSFRVQRFAGIVNAKGSAVAMGTFPSDMFVWSALL